MKKKKKILIAEDDRAIVEVLELILSDAGYEFLALADGVKIEQHIKEYHPDIIFLDIWLAGEDGGKITKKLKGDRTTRKIPIIIVSANTNTAQIAKEVGADDFLAKPFDITTLLTLVEKHTKTKD